MQTKPEVSWWVWRLANQLTASTVGATTWSTRDKPLAPIHRRGTRLICERCHIELRWSCPPCGKGIIHRKPTPVQYFSREFTKLSGAPGQENSRSKSPNNRRYSLGSYSCEVITLTCLPFLQKALVHYRTWYPKLLTASFNTSPCIAGHTAVLLVIVSLQGWYF